MKVLFNLTHRRVYGEKAVEFSFLSVGALIFGQLLSEKDLSFSLVISGMVLFILGLVVSYFLLKGLKGGEVS